MKPKDASVISHLRKNARIPLTKMSRKTGVPVSTLFDKIKYLNGGSIIRYTSLVDFRKIGLNAHAYVLLKTLPEKRSDILKKLSNHRYLNSLFKVNNGWDFLCEVLGRDMSDVEAFIETLESEGVVKKEIHYVLNELTREGFLTDPNTSEMICK